MKLQNILDFLISRTRNMELTPVWGIILVFAFFFLIITYYLSGLKDKIENLPSGKKTVVFLFVALFLFGVYYIFWKAGRFDEALLNPFVQDSYNFIKSKVQGFCQ